MRIYGAAGHDKGEENAMSSFGVKNILRKDIVTYPASKNPQYY